MQHVHLLCCSLTSKYTKQSLLTTFLRVLLKLEEMFGLRFWKLNDKQKGMSNGSSCKKWTIKLWLVYLVFKLQENRCSFSILWEKCKKALEIRYIESKKLQPRCHGSFYLWKCFENTFTDVFRRSKPRSKVQHI